MITTNTKHNNHQVEVDYDHVNAHGQPALVCKQCNKWIQWISKKDLPHLLRIHLNEDFKQTTS